MWVTQVAQVSRTLKCACQIYMLMGSTSENASRYWWEERGMNFTNAFETPWHLLCLWLFCSLYLKQNEKPQGDFLPAVKPMLPKSAEILLFSQRIMSLGENQSQGKGGIEMLERGSHLIFVGVQTLRTSCPLKNFAQCLFISLKKQKNNQVPWKIWHLSFPIALSVSWR